MGGFSECWERRNGPINAPMFFGNTTLALGIFLCMCFLHIIVLSGVEASWLLRVSRSAPSSWRGAWAGIEFSCKGSHVGGLEYLPIGCPSLGDMIVVYIMYYTVVNVK